MDPGQPGPDDSAQGKIRNYPSYNDEAFLTRYGSDISRAAKRVSLYLVIGRKELARSAPVKCYVGGNDMESSLIHQQSGEQMGLSIKLLLLARSPGVSVGHGRERQSDGDLYIP